MWKEYFIYAIENTSLASGTGVTFTDTSIKIDADAHFELLKRSHFATDSRIYATFKSDAAGRYYQNEKLDLRNISADHKSTATILFFEPYVLSVPTILAAGSNYTASFSDFSGSSNSIRLALHGTKLREGNAPWEKHWREELSFDYSKTTTISANQTVSFNIPIDVDAHFIVKKITGTFSGEVLVLIQDVATGKQWMNVPIHGNNILGSGIYPNVLPAPRFIYKGSTINIQVQDLSGASNTLSIVIHGKKLFE
jgi:hypothetical protein